jgi:hypothetical protein
MQNLDLSKLGSSDLLSLEIVIKEYNNNARNEDIMETGFNAESGYVYIALENGIQIASSFGQDVEYIIFDVENGNEHFFETYNEALDRQFEIWA